MLDFTIALAIQGFKPDLAFIMPICFQTLQYDILNNTMYKILNVAVII